MAYGGNFLLQLLMHDQLININVNDLGPTSVMGTVAIICTECSIRVYYDDCSIRASRSFYKFK